MNIRLDDLKLLYIILINRSLAPASSDLNLSQPAITARLNKMRDFYKDELIYRVGNKMHLSEKGYSLIEPLNQLTHHIETVLPRETYSPYDKTKFIIFISESFTMAKDFIPELIKKLKYYNSDHEIIIKIQPVSWSPKPSYTEYLDFDIAIGMHKTALGYNSDITGYQKSVIVYDKYPMKKRGELTYKDFINLPFVVIDDSSSVYIKKQFEKVTGEAVDPRINIQLRIDSLAVVREVLCDQYVVLLTIDHAKIMNLNYIDIPIELPLIESRIIYHERLKLDPKNLWLRKIVKEIVSKYQDLLKLI